MQHIHDGSYKIEGHSSKSSGEALTTDPDSAYGDNDPESRRDDLWRMHICSGGRFQRGRWDRQCVSQLGYGEGGSNA